MQELAAVYGACSCMCAGVGGCFKVPVVLCVQSWQLFVPVVLCVHELAAVLRCL